MWKNGFLWLLLLSACGSPRDHQIVNPQLSPKTQKRIEWTTISLQIQPLWLEGPFGNVHLPTSLMVFIYDKSGRLTDLPATSSLSFFATMPSMGDPLDQPGEFISLSRGVYINRSITFTMTGEWQMELRLMGTNSEIKDRAQWNEFF